MYEYKYNSFCNNYDCNDFLSPFSCSIKQIIVNRNDFYLHLYMGDSNCQKTLENI